MTRFALFARLYHYYRCVIPALFPLLSHSLHRALFRAWPRASLIYLLITHALIEDISSRSRDDIVTARIMNY